LSALALGLSATALLKNGAAEKRLSNVEEYLTGLPEIMKFYDQEIGLELYDILRSYLAEQLALMETATVVVNTGDTMPVGTVLQTVRLNPPPNWMVANGAILSRSAYSELFQAIGERFGSGDGVLTFKIPSFYTTPELVTPNRTVVTFYSAPDYDSSYMSNSQKDAYIDYIASNPSVLTEGVVGTPAALDYLHAQISQHPVTFDDVYRRSQSSGDRFYASNMVLSFNFFSEHVLTGTEGSLSLKHKKVFNANSIHNVGVVTADPFTAASAADQALLLILGTFSEHLSQNEAKYLIKVRN